jgi:hypothetical protein
LHSLGTGSVLLRDAQLGKPTGNQIKTFFDFWDPIGQTQLAARPLNVELFLNFNFRMLLRKEFQFPVSTLCLLLRRIPSQSLHQLKLLKGMKSFQNLFEYLMSPLLKE